MNMINKVLLGLLLFSILGFNLKSQKESDDVSHYKLTSLSEQLLSMFIADKMNSKRLDSLSCSIVLSFGDNSDSDIDLRIYDADLLNSCVNHSYLTRHKGFYIFYKGKINTKYILGIGVAEEMRCGICDSLIKANDIPIVFREYDGAIYKVYKGTNNKKNKIVKIPGG